MLYLPKVLHQHLPRLKSSGKFSIRAPKQMCLGFFCWRFCTPVFPVSQSCDFDFHERKNIFRLVSFVLISGTYLSLFMSRKSVETKKTWKACVALPDTTRQPRPVISAWTSITTYWTLTRRRRLFVSCHKNKVTLITLQYKLMLHVKWHDDLLLNSNGLYNEENIQ